MFQAGHCTAKIKMLFLLEVGSLKLVMASYNTQVKCQQINHIKLPHENIIELMDKIGLKMLVSYTE